MTTGHFRANTYGRHSSLDDLDLYPTAPWAVRCFIPRLEAEGFDPETMSVLEPCNGIGAMSYALREKCKHLTTADICDYGPEARTDYIEDFLTSTRQADLIITNPPFCVANEIILKALANANKYVAMFLRTTFMEGANRYDEIFEPHPPYAVWQFCRRVCLKKDELDPKAAGVIPYSWWLWRTDIDYSETKLRWIRDQKEQWIENGDWDVGKGCIIPSNNYESSFMTEDEEDDYDA